MRSDVIGSTAVYNRRGYQLRITVTDRGYHFVIGWGKYGRNRLYDGYVTSPDRAEKIFTDVVQGIVPMSY